MVHFSMAQQDIRYYLNGLLLVVDGKNVIAVATDGHRLAFCQVATEQENLDELRRLAADGNTDAADQLEELTGE